MGLIPTQGERDAQAVADIYRASGGNATLYTGALLQYYQDQSRLRVLQASDPLPGVGDSLDYVYSTASDAVDSAESAIGDFFKKAEDGVVKIFNAASDAAKNAAVSIGIVQLVLLVIGGFIIYKILTSESVQVR